MVCLDLGPACFTCCTHHKIRDSHAQCNASTASVIILCHSQPWLLPPPPPGCASSPPQFSPSPQTFPRCPEPCHPPPHARVKHSPRNALSHCAPLPPSQHACWPRATTPLARPSRPTRTSAGSPPPQAAPAPPCPRSAEPR